MIATFRRLALRSWESATLTSWASFATRTFSLVLVLPLVLKRFSEVETTLWYLFGSLAGFQLLADLGFGYNFTRLVAYAMGGATEAPELGRPFAEAAKRDQAGEPNWDLLGRIYASMHRVYAGLGYGFFAVAGLAGSWALWLPAGRLTNATEGWLAGAVFLVATSVSLRGNAYSAFLQGTGQVALVRRWEALFSLAAIGSSFAVLLAGGGILSLACANQTWVVLAVARNRWLVHRWRAGTFRHVRLEWADARVTRIAWAGAWRSAIATAMSHSLVLLSGVVAAQQKNSAAAASYLLGLTLVRNISMISQAPFYSKVPLFARLHAEGRSEAVIKIAARAMRLSYLTYIGPLLVVGAGGAWLLPRIGSRTAFPSALMWLTLGAAVLVERYGAMHLQLFQLSNEVKSHIANGVSGLLMIGLATLAYAPFGLLALPAAMLGSYLAFYAPYSAILSHRRFGLAWPEFDLRSGALPALLGFAAGGGVWFYWQARP